MRTNIDLDDDLMRNVIRISGASTKRAAVETAMRNYVNTESQGGIRRLRGKVRWEGDLNQSRLGRGSK